MNTTLINDWKPETQALLDTLRKHGFTIVAGDNGEDGKEAYVNDEQIIRVLTACDEAHLIVRHTTSDREHWIYLVYGNNPGELPSDYNILLEKDAKTLKDEGKYAEANAMLDAATKEHNEEWEKKGQPKIEEWKVYPCRKCGKHHEPSAGQTCLESLNNPMSIEDEVLAEEKGEL